MNIEKGEFWLPGNPSHKVSGFLKYSNDNIELDLVGCFYNISSSLTPVDYKIINGTLGMNPVILYDCFESHRDIFLGTSDYTSITVNMIFFGINAVNTSDLQFHKCTFSPLHYNEWVNKKDGWKFKVDQKKFKINVNYELPDPIITTLNNGMKCGINFKASSPNWGYYQEEVNIKQGSYFSIESGRKKPFRILLLHLSQYSKLMTVFMQNGSFMDDIIIYLKDFKSKKYIKSNVFTTSRSRSNIKKPRPNDFLVNYSDIIARYDKILNIWYSNTDKINTALNSYFDTYYEFGVIDDFALKILKAMEAYHREFIGPNSTSLLNRYLALFSRTRRAFNPYLKIPSMPKYCKKLKNLRHDLAHNNPVTVSKPGLYKIRYKLVMESRMILTSNILLDLGISVNEIRNIIKRSNAFSNIKKN